MENPQRLIFSDVSYKWKYLQYFCGQCDRDFNTKHMLNNHMKREHQCNSFECEYCDGTFNSLKQLTIHENDKHNQVNTAEKTVVFDHVNCVISEEPNTEDTREHRKESNSIKQQKIRFKETTEEQPVNAEWI